MIDVEEILALQKRVHDLRDGELVLLNGHLLIERVLVAAVAARLRCQEHDLPQMAFAMKARLTRCTDAEREKILWLNRLRNALVHEFGALNTKSFASTVVLFEFPWPDGQLERAATLELIVWDVLGIALFRYVEELYFEENVLDGDDAKHHDTIEAWTRVLYEVVTYARPLAHQNRWDTVLEIMKPGWRPA